MSSAIQPDKKPVRVATWSALDDRQPVYALVADVDLVVVRYDAEVSVLYGRCLHRGALMADGHVDGDNLICGVHQWDYRLDSGVSEYDNDEGLEKFRVDRRKRRCGLRRRKRGARLGTRASTAL